MTQSLQHTKQVTKATDRIKMQSLQQTNPQAKNYRTLFLQRTHTQEENRIAVKPKQTDRSQFLTCVGLLLMPLCLPVSLLLVSLAQSCFERVFFNICLMALFSLPCCARCLYLIIIIIIMCVSLSCIAVSFINSLTCV